MERGVILTFCARAVEQIEMGGAIEHLLASVP